MSFLKELKRRNVFRVGVAYLVLGWVVVQVTDVVAPALGLPDFTLKLVLWLGVVGFPFALLLAWAFELTPEGIKRTSQQCGEQRSHTQDRGTPGVAGANNPGGPEGLFQDGGGGSSRSRAVFRRRRGLDRFLAPCGAPVGWFDDSQAETPGIRPEHRATTRGSGVSDAGQQGEPWPTRCRELPDVPDGDYYSGTIRITVQQDGRPS